MTDNSSEQTNTHGSCMLSTIDNPYDPFDNTDEWRLYDNEHDHYSAERLARVAHVSEQLSDEEYLAEIERAIDEIISYDFLNIYTKVYIKEKE